MFRPRIKKTYPPGTFIPTPARVAAILQLCVAFTILLWHLSQPFMGDLFAVKSKMLLYQHIMEQSAFYGELPLERKEQIEAEYSALQLQLDQPFLRRLQNSVEGLFLRIPPFELAWLFLSILLPILLLKRVEGAVQAIWLLPLLAAAYALDNRLQGMPPQQSAEMELFPTEEMLVKDLSANFFEQQEQLKRGWEAYLIKEWGGEAAPLERGKFAFNLARLEAQNKDAQIKKIPQESLGALALYLFWNLSIALLAKGAFHQVNGDPSKIA